MARIKKISLILVLCVFLVSISALAINVQFTPSVQNGQEMQNVGYKFSKSNNILTATKSSISCSWKPDRIDDGWKLCEAVFEIENQNAVKPVIQSPTTNFIFKNNNVRNKQVSFSTTYTLVNETYLNGTLNVTNAGTAEAYVFTKRKFSNFISLPSQIDTSKPFAIKLGYEAPKYNVNRFSMGLSSPGFNVFIDPIQSSCGTLSNLGAIYTLNQDVSSTGTCFIINNSNIVLDCNRYKITYGSGSTSYNYAVDNTGGFDNVTIKNCDIAEGNWSNQAQFAIYFDSGQNGTIWNNKITTGGLNSRGIFIRFTSDFTNISSNNISTFGINGYGIYFHLSHSNTAYYNILNTSGNSSAGLTLSQSRYNTAFSNKINTSGSNSYGLYLTFDSNFNNLSSNEITTLGSNAYGIYLDYPEFNNTFLNNNISSGNTYEIKDLVANSFNNYLNSLIYNNSFGMVHWTKNNLTTNITLSVGKTIYLEPNRVGLIDDKQALNLNSTAQIEIRGLSYGSAPPLLKAGVRCDNNPDRICNVSYDRSIGTLFANVSFFSNYSTPWEVDVYNVSVVQKNTSGDGSASSIFRFLMKNIASYLNSYYWTLEPGDASSIKYTIGTLLSPNETVFVFVEHLYATSGTYTIVANGTTSIDVDRELKVVGIG